MVVATGVMKAGASLPLITTLFISSMLSKAPALTLATFITSVPPIVA
jgi:hypothetical protein